MYEEREIYHAIVISAIVLLVLVSMLLFSILHYHYKKLRLRKIRFKRQINALEKEKARIARDLHDDLGSQLFGIKIKLQCLELTNKSEMQHILKSTVLLEESMQKLKRIAYAMLPQVLESKGLEQALEDLVGIGNQFNTSLKINLICKCPPLPAETAMYIYRIIQEAVNNILKHSSATIAQIELENIGKELVLKITDNGVGFEHEKIGDNGLGIHNISVRTELLNAKMSLTTHLGHGVTWLFKIPHII